MRGMHPLLAERLTKTLARLDEKDPERARKVRELLSTTTTTDAPAAPKALPPSTPPDPMDVGWMKEATSEINKLQARCGVLEQWVAAVSRDLGIPLPGATPKG